MANNEAKSMPSVGACQELCKDLQDCYHFTFEGGNCFLFGRDRGEETNTIGAISGPKSCDAASADKFRPSPPQYGTRKISNFGTL